MAVKKNIANFLILVLAICLSLLFIEGILRLFSPQYKYAASSKYSISPYRLFSRVPNSVGVVEHPDTGGKHLFITNELAQHQHRTRNLSLLDNKNYIKIGIFGDSFTENMRIKSQYSFVEVLDYLLNCNKNKFEVYNFGVEGYGTDQSFVYYRDSPLAPKMNYVLYIFCSNDIRNNFENKIFSIDSNMKLLPSGKYHSNFIKKFLAKLYLTYFVEEIYYKLAAKYNFTIEGVISSILNVLGKEAPKNIYEKVRNGSGLKMERDLLSGKNTNATKYAKDLFDAIIVNWEKLVQSRGGKFIIVSLPRPSEHLLKRFFVGENNFVDLWEQFYGNVHCSMNNGDCQKFYNPWRFKNNDHWNEAGNLKAAILLYKYFIKVLGMHDYGDKWLNQRLVEYYSAFPGGWLPYKTGLVTFVNTLPNHANEIRNKYNELDAKYYDLLKIKRN